MKIIWFALLILLSLAGFLGYQAWHSPRKCLLVYMPSGLDLKIDPQRTWKPGDYVFHLAFNDKNITCSAQLPASCDKTSVFQCSDRIVRVHEKSCLKGMPALSGIHIDTAPSFVSVEIEHDGKNILTRKIAPHYKMHDADKARAACADRKHASYDLFTAE